MSNVEVHFAPARRITEDGLIGSNGIERKVDTIICATSFDASFLSKAPHCLGECRRFVFEIESLLWRLSWPHNPGIYFLDTLILWFTIQVSIFLNLNPANGRMRMRKYWCYYIALVFRRQTLQGSVLAPLPAVSIYNTFGIPMSLTQTPSLLR